MVDNREVEGMGIAMAEAFTLVDRLEVERLEEEVQVG